MDVRTALDQREWDAFLSKQQYRPFLQSWTMGEVYNEIGQEPVRVQLMEGNAVAGIAFGHVVPAKRGRHLSVPYGPVIDGEMVRWSDGAQALINKLKEIAKGHQCAFIRISPFLKKEPTIQIAGAQSSPLHLLAEHLWYLPLTTQDTWAEPSSHLAIQPSVRAEDEIFSSLRATHRNLIRRAQKEGVTIRASVSPNEDIKHFLELHEETRKRHGFTPYTDSFFRSQLQKFSERSEATLYLAEYQGQVIASSIHMHMFGETSYHHGASTHKFSKIPASYFLQWTAICDAIKRGDHVYNFWGIAPIDPENQKPKTNNQKHPFAGVTMFKTGFNGKLLELTHCFDIQLSTKYYLTWGFEQLRKRRRGF